MAITYLIDVIFQIITNQTLVNYFKELFSSFCKYKIDNKERVSKVDKIQNERKHSDEFKEFIIDMLCAV